LKAPKAKPKVNEILYTTAYVTVTLTVTVVVAFNNVA